MASKIQPLDVHLRVNNVARSAEWYQRMLGCKVEMAAPDPMKPAFVRLTQTQGEAPAVMLSNGSDFMTGKRAPKATAEAIAARKAPRVVSLYFSVDSDVDKLYASVKRKGAKVAQELVNQPYGMRDFAIQDPDGYVVGVGQAIG
ncbi:MAG: hypothetical protein FJZ92_06765 [Chloroflexi bacterium]|nr:hypothetical protein [Chloroflexota bacterium]